MNEKLKAARSENIRKAVAAWSAQRRAFDYMAHFKSKTTITESGCWHFNGSKNEKGYGQVSVHGKTWAIHRWSYTVHKGPIPAGLMICHSCDNPSCWNPEHLWAGTMSENAFDSARKGRAKEARKTQCPHGHPFAGENLYVSPNGKRHCRTCAREKGRRRWREQPEYMRERLRRQRAAKRSAVSEGEKL